MKLSRRVRRSLAQFRAHPLRTSLALLGMVLGVSSVVAMVSIGEGAQREILAGIEALGGDVVHLEAKDVPDDKVGELVNRSAGLARNDIPLALKTARAEDSAYLRWSSLSVTDLPSASYQLQLAAVSPSVFRLHQLQVARGRGLLELDDLLGRRVAVLGAEVAQALGAGALGRRVRLGYAYFEVVGVLAPKPAGSALALEVERYNRAVLVPFHTSIEELSPAEVYRELDVVSLRVASLEQTASAKRALLPVLKSLHGGVEDVEVVAPEEILEQKRATQAVLNMVLTSIAAISLLVGGIGVMNIMLANVVERIPEIGLRRAIGASQADVLRQFLLEAVVVCFVGGSFGVLLGFAISLLVAKLVALKVAFAWSAVLLSFGLSVTVGLLFGLWPAVRASRVSPVRALGHF